MLLVGCAVLAHLASSGMLGSRDKTGATPLSFPVLNPSSLVCPHHQASPLCIWAERQGDKNENIILVKCLTSKISTIDA